MTETRDIGEVVELANIDSNFFKHHFFPKAFRKPSAPVHGEMWDALEDPDARYIGVSMPRDWAKTTNLRAYLAKRISYGVSRTIMVVGISEEAAVRTLSWVKKNVLYNHKWAQVFGLSKGDRWSGAHIEVKHGALSMEAEKRGEPPVVITVLAVGITGATRGINIDDYRPDLILIDDPCDEENTATPEQREKSKELIFGALYNSLAPRSESPEAKLVVLQTPLDADDIIANIEQMASWKFLRISCFTEDGLHSTWESRHPYKELKQEKLNAIDGNRLHIWMREKEVTIVSRETSAFRVEHLQYWEELPDGGVNILAIDPTPPPKENTASSGKLKKLDDAVILALKIYDGKVFLMDSYEKKSPNPEEFIGKILEFAVKYKVYHIAIETILFARTTKFYLERTMLETYTFYRVVPVEDKRAKPLRIEQEVGRYAQHRQIYVRTSDGKFIDQFTKYPAVKHDDYLDAMAIGLTSMTPAILQLSQGVTIEGDYSVYTEEEKFLLNNWRSQI